MEKTNLGLTQGCELNLGATELRLGLPGCDDTKTQSCVSNPINATRNKRCFSQVEEHSSTKSNSDSSDTNVASPAKTQVVGWPPVRSYRKNTTLQQKKDDQESDGTVMFVKVSMDGAPYLRKIGLEVYKSYPELLKALQNMFKCIFGEYSEREGYHGSEHVPTYQDKDGDWMLVGDVPWDMFITSCKRLRIMRASDAKGLGCL